MARTQRSRGRGPSKKVRAPRAPKPPVVFVTGAGGYIGRLAVKALAEARDDRGDPLKVVACDIRPPDERIDGVIYETADVRSPDLQDLVAEHRITSVVHLAAVVTPGKGSDRQLEYSVDVMGTRNVLDACVRAEVRQLVVSSSGAAYGYYADNPGWLDEEDEIRGNPEFAYSDHKRQVEHMLQRARDLHPSLRQLIFRPGTVLGATTRNQITDLFDARMVIGIRNSDSPFVFIWDEDVAQCIVRGVLRRSSGIYNLAGDGALPMRELARIMGKPYIPLPVRPTRVALAVLKRLGRTQYGPEQLDFLRYRPVLSNRRLKEEFGYTPAKTTREVFDYFLQERAHVR